ncbi:MAG: GDP-L-fucose synthase [Methanobacteriota archaeon]|nr:MAG: GDP-L-fucose synthase [Euryarchaeota archaeon]
MRKLRVLLTGASGMVGRNLLEHPDIGQFKLLTPPRAELDLLDFNSVYEYLREHRPDIVLHAAGKVGGIQANIREPVKYLTDNLDMGRNIVLASRKTGIKRLLNLGSSCMYPRDRRDPLSEDMILKGELEPTNEGYALAKIVVARLCEYIMREDGSFQYKTLIPCNLYGRHDKFNPKHSHLVPAIIYKIHHAMQEGATNIEIWGDGMARREFMYAGDFADALVHALREFDSLPSYMNIGVGQDYSINEYYRVAAEVMGFNGRFVHNLEKPVGMKRKLLDISQQKGWGWMPKTTLHEGIAQTYQYFLEECGR